MSQFQEFNMNKQLQNAVDDLGFTKPTPIQEESFSVIKAGKNVVGIAQTGTGKTLAYALPILETLKYSEQDMPRVLVLVPTRELVLQVVEQFEELCKYQSVRVLGVYGGTNINTQKDQLYEGTDVLVATPGRLYDLALSRAADLRGIKKLVIDEVDVMLDLGFRFQIGNIFELIPDQRQNIMFSATMTEEVEELIDRHFVSPVKISIAVSGTPLDNIAQSSYPVRNFYTKVNLLAHLLEDEEEFKKVLVFIGTKKLADRLHERLEDRYGEEIGVIHSNKSQNYRIRSIRQFDEGENRILIATDVMARGLDLDQISHVINFDTPQFPENYMHRIGRTGRAEEEGRSILFFTEAEESFKLGIEILMDTEIPELPFPEQVNITEQLIPEEKPEKRDKKNPHRNQKKHEPGPAFHEKKEKNKKVNLGGSYRGKMAAKYKKPQRRSNNKPGGKKGRR